LNGLVVRATGAPSGANLFVQVYAIANARYGLSDPSRGIAFRPVLGQLAQRSGRGSAPQVTLAGMKNTSLVIGGGYYRPAGSVSASAGEIDGSSPTASKTAWSQHGDAIPNPNENDQASLTLGASVTPARSTGSWAMAAIEVLGMAPGWYIGLQNRQVVFSAFGATQAGADPHCAPDADGEGGVHCFTPFSPKVGHEYELTVRVTPQGARNEFSATILDKSDPQQTTPQRLSAWTAPAEFGLIGRGFIQFSEYPIAVPQDCTQQRYGSVLFTAPKGIASSGAASVSGSYYARWVYPYADCAEFANAVFTDTTAVSGTGYLPGAAFAGSASVAGAETSVTTPPLNGTFSGNDGLLVAFVASQADDPVTSVSSPEHFGITWTRRVVNNAAGGDTQVWTAPAPSYTGTDPRVCNQPCQAFDGLTVTATKAASYYTQFLTVRTYRARGLGAIATGGDSSGAPSVSLTPRDSGSVITAIGYDWSSATLHVAGPGQTIHEQVSDPVDNEQIWIQSLDASPAAGTPVEVSDVAPTNEYWNLTAVEISIRP
jgi:hypothetical protein